VMQYLSLATGLQPVSHPIIFPAANKSISAPMDRVPPLPQRRSLRHFHHPSRSFWQLVAT
jgi:hypothetical protein